MIWVIVPALNEADNLRVLVPRIVKTLESIGDGGRVLVVDDGSTDDTGEVMAELASAWPGIELESLAAQPGQGGCVAARFRPLAIEGGAEVVVMMDADGQDDPDELPKLVARLEAGADLVTGARLMRQDRFVKRNTSKVYNRVTGVLSGAPGRDFNSGYKVMTADVARDVTPMMYGEMHRYLTVIAHDLGYQVVEEAVQHHPRMSGESKYGLARFWRGFSDLVTVRFLLSYENRPSHLFGGVGAFLFFLGVVTLGYLTVEKITGEPIGDRPLLMAGVLLTLVGLQLALFGLLAELIVHARNRDRAARS